MSSKCPKHPDLYISLVQSGKTYAMTCWRCEEEKKRAIIKEKITL